MGRTRQLRTSAVMLIAGLSVLSTASAADPPAPLMPLEMMVRLTRQHLVALPRRTPADLLTQSDLEPFLTRVEQAGWSVPYKTQLLEQMVGDQDFLAQFARSPRGQKWLRQAATQPILFDRVDRISRVQDGQRMLNNVAKLPDGARYARPTPGLYPDLIDLLPKRGKNGKRRQVEDYHKPTGRAYTLDQVLALLKDLHKEAELKLLQNPPVPQDYGR